MGGGLAAQFVEAPNLFASSGIERYDTQLGCGHKHDAVDDDRIALNVGIFVSVVAIERPSDFQLTDILGVNLSQGGVMNSIGGTARYAPATIVIGRNATSTSYTKAEA